MSPFAVQVMRRVALLACLLAALLIGVPWALTWAGLIGPGAREDIESADRALAAARSYGAESDEPALAAGSSELSRARQLLEAGRAGEARRAAARARALGIDAQRAALGAREASRRRAEAVVNEIDARLNELERLYDERTRGMPQAEQQRLLSSMKEARQAGGGAFLAFDQGEFKRVLALEAEVREKLRQVERQLEARPKP